MFKSFFNWLKSTGKGSATKQRELDEANAAPYKVESPKTYEEKIEEATMKNGDLDAPPELVARAARLDVPQTDSEVKPVVAKKPRKPRAPKAQTTDAAKPKKPRAPKAPAKNKQ